MKKSYLLIDLIFTLLILGVVFLFLNYNFTGYLFSGDFRFNIFNSVRGDQFLSLISHRFSNNNFIYISFYSLYFLMQYVSYPGLLIFIFFGIPLLLFFSLKFVIIRFLKFKYNSHSLYFLISSLCFYYAVNPALFDRYGHFTILYGFIFFPLYVYLLYQYFRTKSMWNIYLLALPIIVYLGVMAPHFFFLYVATGLFFFVSMFFGNRLGVKRYLAKTILIASVSFIALLNIVIPVLLGYGVTKSGWEAPTTASSLIALSNVSNIYTAISGTNFYFDSLIKFPVWLSVGFLIFLITILFMMLSKKIDGKQIIFLLFTLLSLFLVAGYSTFTNIYDLLIKTPISSFLWLIKDPNMYYLMFLVSLLILAGLVISSKKVKPLYLYSLSAAFIFLNILFILASNRSEYNKFYEFVNVPKEYISLSQTLKNDSGRNLWLPADIYVSKSFAKQDMFFPSPSLWLTQNRELAGATNEYIDLIKNINSQIYANNCSNKYWLNWIIAAQKLNVIIDKNTINGLAPDQGKDRDEMLAAEKCLKTLPNAYLSKEIGNLYIYRSNLTINNDVYAYKGNINDLNNFLKSNPSNIIYSNSNKVSVIKMPFSNYTILNESYDQNWKVAGQAPLYEVNFASMLFKAKGKAVYRGENIFQYVVSAQRILIILFVIPIIYIKIKELMKRRKNIKHD